MIKAVSVLVGDVVKGVVYFEQEVCLDFSIINNFIINNRLKIFDITKE